MDLSALDQSLRPKDQPERLFMQPKQRSSTISKTQYDMQQSLSKRYLYERALLDEVIYEIMSQASSKPIEDRIDFNRLEQYIRYELSYNGLNEPFSFQVMNFNNVAVYSSRVYIQVQGRDLHANPVPE